MGKQKRLDWNDRHRDVAFSGLLASLRASGCSAELLEYISVVAWGDVISEVMLKSNGAMGDVIIGSHWRAK
jgi:hypothetical protein